MQPVDSKGLRLSNSSLPLPKVSLDKGNFSEELDATFVGCCLQQTFRVGEPSTLRENVHYRPTLLMKGMDQEHGSVSDTPRNKRACKRASYAHIMRDVASVCQDFIFPSCYCY
jgi:hypothetical protein